MAIRGSYVTAEDIDAEMFGEPHQGTISYLRDRVERYAPRITEIFNGFFDDSRELFERHNGERALRRIRARIRKSADVLRTDSIIPLRTIEDLQRAKPVMQRYVMANIMARIAAADQTIDGYSDSYRTDRPDRRGFDDPDFMRVIDGVILHEDRWGIRISENNPENAWVCYQNLFDSDERDLDIIEQHDILSTWDVLEMHLQAKKKDPTSGLNESM